MPVRPCHGANATLKKVLCRNVINQHTLQAISLRGHLCLACSDCGKWCYKGRSHLHEELSCPSKVGRSVNPKGMEAIRRLKKGLHPDRSWGDEPLELITPWAKLVDGSEDDLLHEIESWASPGIS